MKDSLAEFLARLQAHDDTAAQELFERFAGQLIALARRRCAAGLEHKVDLESVVQSAGGSLTAGGTVSAPCPPTRSEDRRGATPR
jgi:hypothetical protein